MVLVEYIHGREFCAILAGLRLLVKSRNEDRVPLDIQKIETGLTCCENQSLTDEEINKLCDFLKLHYLENKADDQYFQKYLLTGEAPSEDTVLFRLDISTRLATVLREMNFHTVGDLKNLSKERFLLIKGVGKSTLRELERVLHRPLSDARFEERRDESFGDRSIRLTQWYLNN